MTTGHEPAWWPELRAAILADTPRWNPYNRRLLEEATVTIDGDVLRVGCNSPPIRAVIAKRVRGAGVYRGRIGE